MNQEHQQGGDEGVELAEGEMPLHSVAACVVHMSHIRSERQ